LPAIGPLKWKRYGFSFGKLERSGIGGGSYDDDEYVFIFWNFKRSKALNLFILAKYEVVQARGDSFFKRSKDQVLVEARMMMMY
jgi:hypothetical protein